MVTELVTVLVSELVTVLVIELVSELVSGDFTVMFSDYVVMWR